MVTLFHPTLTGWRNALPKESPKRNVQKEKIETDKRRKLFFHTFLYLLGEGTNQRYVPRRSVVPKTPNKQKWCYLLDGHCRKVKDDIVSFFKGKILFSFTHASSPFPLETSGSFLKFNSFLFIYLFIFLNLIFYLFICSLQTNTFSNFFHDNFDYAITMMVGLRICWQCSLLRGKISTQNVS